MLQKRPYLSALIACVGMLTGCAGEEEIPMLTVEPISLYADLDANQNSATAIDLVLVYSLQLNKTISSLSTAKYFEHSEQLRRDNPTGLDIWHWELVPGQSVENFTIDQSKGDAFDGYIFANYLSPGDHKLKLGPSGEVKVLLLRNEIKDLAALNVQHVRRGVTTPQAPKHLKPKALSAHEKRKAAMVGRSTSDYQHFDRATKGGEEVGPTPYVFEVPGKVTSESLKPLSLVGDSQTLPCEEKRKPRRQPEADDHHEARPARDCDCPEARVEYTHPEPVHKQPPVSLVHGHVHPHPLPNLDHHHPIEKEDDDDCDDE